MQYSLFNQSLNDIDNGSASRRIITPSLKQLVEIKILFVPSCKALQYIFCQLIHGEAAPSDVLTFCRTQLGNYSADIGRNCAALRIE